MFAARAVLLTASSVVSTPVSLVGFGSTDSSSITLPTHQVGDLFVIFSYSTNTTVPSIPSAGGTVPTFVGLDTGTGSGNASRTAYAVATATNHTSGTWTNGNATAVAVLRGQNGSTPIGGHAETGGSVGTAPGTGTYTSPSITLSDSSGASILLYFYGGENSASWDSAPAGYTRRTSSADVCLNTKDSSTSDGSVAQTATLTIGQGNFRSAVVEILD